MLTQTFKILILFVMMLSGVANAIAEEFMYVYSASRRRAHK